MMKDNNKILDEAKFRVLMQDSKLTASENLKFRIMQQIETEQALAPKKVKSEKHVIKSVLGIAVVMYILVVILAVGAFLMGGLSALTSVEFILPAVVIASVSAVFGLIIVLDERRYQT